MGVDMMGVEKPKFNGIEKYVFADVYVFFTKYVDGDGSDTYWKNCVEEGRKLCKKYQDFKLCVDMIVATLSDLEFKISGNKDKTGRTYKDWEILLLTKKG